jgi:microcystin-dependent protein
MAASPVKAEDIDPLNPANSLCDEMLKALRLRDQMREFLDWLLTVDGNIEDNVLEGIADRLTPVGSIQMWASQSMPSTKWLLCNGQAVSRTTYASLFLRIGTVFGAGNGSTTFQLPNFTDRSPIGAGAQYTAGLEVGASTVALTASQIPRHTHPISSTGGFPAVCFNAFVQEAGGDGNPSYSFNGSVPETTNVTGENTPAGAVHNNVHPSLGIYFIIKAL